VALSECSRIDECQRWADKTEALASYARQAGDDSLRKLADRIQARAIRRRGELLRQVAAAYGANQNIREGAHPNVSPTPTRQGIAEAAGLSEHQRKTALRVAAVPAEEFERQVESEAPPTVTQLAEQGRKPREAPVIDLGGRNPEDFAAATQVMGAMRSLARCTRTGSPTP
jgi:hypothetical protein